MEQFNRLIACKIWLNELKEENFVQRKTDFESSYILFKDKQISRINVIANVVNKFTSEDENYISITIDDNTCQIRLKTWGDNTKILKKVNIGDIVLVVGKIKNYNNEIYIIPEVIKKVDINFELLRKAELIKEYGLPNKEIIKDEEVKVSYEEIKFSSNDLRNELLNLIEKNEESLGISLEDIKIKLHADLNEINNILQELLKDGEVYEVKGKYRLLI
jgi:RPA family protein